MYIIFVEGYDVIDAEFLKLEHVLNTLKKFTVIKTCEIHYINDDTGKIKIFNLESGADILGAFNELVDRVKIVSYKIYFEKYFVFHFLDDENVIRDVWNLGGIRIHSDYTLILSFERLMEELLDFDDYRKRFANIEGKKGLE